MIEIKFLMLFFIFASIYFSPQAEFIFPRLYRFYPLFVIPFGYDSRIVIFREIIAAGVFVKVDIRLTEFSRFGRQRNNRSADYGKIAVVIRIVCDDHDYEAGLTSVITSSIWS